MMSKKKSKGEIDRDDLWYLLAKVLPEEGDLNGFLFSTFRSIRPSGISSVLNRKTRTERLIEQYGVEFLTQALRRYLPSTFQEELDKLRNLV